MVEHRRKDVELKNDFVLAMTVISLIWNSWVDGDYATARDIWPSDESRNA